MQKTQFVTYITTIGYLITWVPVDISNGAPIIENYDYVELLGETSTTGSPITNPIDIEDQIDEILKRPQLKIFLSNFIYPSQRNNSQGNGTSTTPEPATTTSSSTIDFNNRDYEYEFVNDPVKFRNIPDDYDAGAADGSRVIQAGQAKLKPQSRQERGPQGDLSTVCQFRSTLYNLPAINKWLNMEIIKTDPWRKEGWSKWVEKRPIYMSLRAQLYNHGISEQCHFQMYDDWHKYLTCAILRNQRMEYLIPQYPLHQVPYHAITQYYTDVSKEDN